MVANHFIRIKAASAILMAWEQKPTDIVLNDLIRVYRKFSRGRMNIKQFFA